MKITEAFAEDLAGVLAKQIAAAYEDALRVWRIIDPRSQSSGSKMPYPPDAGWLTALQQQVFTCRLSLGYLDLTLSRLEKSLSQMQSGEPVSDDG